MTTYAMEIVFPKKKPDGIRVVHLMPSGLIFLFCPAGAIPDLNDPGTDLMGQGKEVILRPE